MLDDVYVSTNTGSMCLQFLTIASDMGEKDKVHLMNQSKDRAIVVLDDMTYYSLFENAMRVDSYVKQRNVQQLTKSVQDIIDSRQKDANRDKESAIEALEKAIGSDTLNVDAE